MFDNINKTDYNNTIKNIIRDYHIIIGKALIEDIDIETLEKLIINIDSKNNILKGVINSRKTDTETIDELYKQFSFMK